MKFSIELPLPPSANNAYATNKRTGKRFPVKSVKEWQKEAGWCLQEAKPPKLCGPYTFDIYVPEKMRGDCSNRIKLAEDLFVKLGVTPDDKYAVDSSSHRSADVPAGRCVVVVSELEALPL